MVYRRNFSIIINLLWWLSLQFQGSKIKADFQARIINGQEVKWNSTRYQVSIRLEEIDRYFFGVGHLCGGSIIARYAILTSAHCVWNANTNSVYAANKFSVVMGNLDRSLNDENSLKFSVSKIITGSHFNSSTLRDDLAIMFLNESIPENFAGAEVIQLNDNISINDYTTCLVTGWGLTEKQTYTTNLMMIEIPIVDRTICSLNYGSETILDGMLCAGYMSGKSDACSGDSGGPLVCDNKLVGIVSFGLGCAMPGYPGVYTNVAYYYDWIQNHAGLTVKNHPLGSNNTLITTLNSTSISSIRNAMAKPACSNFINICLILYNIVKFGTSIKIEFMA